MLFMARGQGDVAPGSRLIFLLLKQMK